MGTAAMLAVAVVSVYFVSNVFRKPGRSRKSSDNPDDSKKAKKQNA